MMLVILVLKVTQFVYNLRDLLLRSSRPLAMVSGNHVLLGYYLTITIVECMSAVWLLKNFRAVLRKTVSSPLRGGRLYRYIMRSTEVRLVTMAFIGIGRTITTSVNMSLDKQHAGLATDSDSFIYAVECLFPIVM